MSIIETKCVLFFLLTLGDEILSCMTEIWMKYQLVSDNTNNIVNLCAQTLFTRNEEIMVGSQLMLVTLHMRFIISNEQRQIELVTLNKIFSVAKYTCNSYNSCS